MARQLEQHLRSWARDGWTATKTKGGHWRLNHPDAAQPVFCPSTPSDWRGIMNTEALLRRLLRSASPPPTGPAADTAAADTDTATDTGETNNQDHAASTAKATHRPVKTTRSPPVVFDLYGIQTPARSFRRSGTLARGEWVTDADLVYSDGVKSEPSQAESVQDDDTTLILLAWSFAYMRLRSEGYEVDVIRTLRKRYRTDDTFRQTLLKRFQDSTPADYNLLRSQRRNGMPAVVKPASIVSEPRPPAPAPLPKVQVVNGPGREPVTEQNISLLRIKLMEAEKACEVERAQVASLKRTLDAKEAAFQAELIEMRTRKNHAEAVRDDMEQQLEEEKARRSEAADETLGPNLKLLAGMIADNAALVDRRLSAIEQAFDTRLSVIEQNLLLLHSQAEPLQPASRPRVQKPLPITDFSNLSPKRQTGPKRKAKAGQQDEPDLETMGGRIRQKRIEHGFSQAKLGQMIGTSGATLSIWETGKAPVGDQYVKKLSKALKVSEIYLVGSI